jgi:hypothetical protein
MFRNVTLTPDTLGWLYGSLISLSLAGQAGIWAVNLTAQPERSMESVNPYQGEVERQGGEQSGEDLSRAGQNIEVLGTPLLTLAGQPSELSGKSLALVCSLELEGETRRAALADLLWTDALEDAGRRNLRRELHRLRSTAVGD